MSDGRAARHRCDASQHRHANGGKDPVWNADHTFEISTEKELLLEVFDKEQVGNDKFMGHARVSIVDWIAAGTFTGDVDVTDMSDRPVGKVNLKATFFRPGEGGELVAQGATRENEAPSEAGPANEPWQEQHWSERLPQSPEKGAPGEWEEQWDDRAQATFWYNRKTGEASWVDPTQQHLLGTPER
jgi:GH18 family chitinase